MACKPLDKMDTPERLQLFARNIREFGPDIRNWGKPDHVADLMDEHAARVIVDRAWSESENKGRPDGEEA